MLKASKLLAAAASLFLAGVAEAQAAPLSFGMTLEHARIGHPQAQISQRYGPKTLSWQNTTLDGVAWRTVNLIFDSADRLTSITLEADPAERSNVQALISRELEESRDVLSPAVLAVPEDVEMKLCENSVTGFALTFQRPSYKV